MKCKFCGEELYDEHEMYIGGHPGCIEEMRFNEENDNGMKVTATILIDGSRSAAWNGDTISHNVYQMVSQMIEDIVAIHGGDSESALFSIVVEGGGGGADIGHPEEILGMARLQMQRLGLVKDKAKN
ncbi:hypothetical protein ACFQ4Y_16435 [Kroppenstedtia sanguinis]|uniref:Uncharacterized protein n=2 Tax=Kroppenstedtia sanguinis TaxID=1380684 RepID=A0ABW4CCJ4_9BACL